MLKKISTIPFKGTPEQEASLREIIEKHKDDPGAIMPVLQQAQEVYGYLPIEVQTIIAEGLGVPLEEVYGVSGTTSPYVLAPRAMSRARAKLLKELRKSSALSRRNVRRTASSR